uniref:DUF952 domain-containing protein n=1 Tax=Setaria viridis TaxID=4556 RepID=A0A4U6SWD1_SETVI|nr:hypothetical protein SEVIR_9G185200v2 [Setaria viridis]
MANQAGPAPPAFVYRISTADEWAELQGAGATLGGDLDRSTGCIHLSDLNQVKMTLKNFFLGRNDLYLLQIDTSKLADGLIYEGLHLPCQILKRRDKIKDPEEAQIGS